MNRYDLHCHSTASDGVFSPTEVVATAVEAGINVLALTDHDTTDGLEEARQAADLHNISLINGLEISVSWFSYNVHIVGLGVDLHSEPLQKGLQKIRDFRAWRAEEIGRRLRRDAGIEGAYEGAKSFSNGQSIGRGHFARHLISIGVEPDYSKVFKRYLVRGKPGYVPGEWAELSEAVNWINQAGGQAVIAHPARYKMSRKKLCQLLVEFRELGGAALEVVSGTYSKDDIFNMANLAIKYELLASAGSDYHAPGNWSDFGKLPNIPDNCKPIWHDWPTEQAIGDN
ncbi:MAG: PHP domain-containing protein [Candidatus Polarisedimenticolaceae bacterium]|nr:PHP domain-containing protein [Candidatus Polarisedimenticolaceae bacterium]